jgi:cytochrome c
MSKFLKTLCLGAALAALPFAASAGDAAKGEKVFKKCAACHAVGDGARNKVGPELNDILGRTAGSLEDYKYSSAMVEAGNGGLVWDETSLDTFLARPKDMIKGTKMAFAGLKKQEDLDNVIAYLASFSSSAPGDQQGEAEPAAQEEPRTASAETQLQPVSTTRDGGVFGLGRAATADEVAAWDIDVRPDGTGLPEGKGTVAEGEVLYTDNCAVCHGDFGEGVGRWPVLAGGQDTLAEERPEKTIGSYWPYLSTVYDYVRRAMPYGNARSLSDDEVYALTAYLLYLNDIVTDEEFELSKQNFADIRLPNEDNFIADDRAEEPQYARKGEPCMSDCKDGAVKITMRARILDVTPGSVDDDEASGVGGVD